MFDENGFYERLKAERARAGDPDTPNYDSCVRETVDELIRLETSPGSSVTQACKVQSGRTRVLLGVITLGFDKGFEIAVVLTEGAKAHGNQMAKRIRNDLKLFRDEKTVQVFDIAMMSRVTLGEIDHHKVVIVAKKEPADMDATVALFTEIHSELLAKRTLIIADESDAAASRPARRAEVDEANQGRVSSQIEELRRRMASPAYLQISATAHALYLQPGVHERRARTCSPLEFRLLVMNALRVSQRYKRPFAVARLTFPNLDALRESLGVTAANAAFRNAVDAILGALRVSDFVGVRDDNSAIIALPETGVAQVYDVIASRMRAMIRLTTEIPLELSIEAAEGDEIASMLAKSVDCIPSSIVPETV